MVPFCPVPLNSPQFLKVTRVHLMDSQIQTALESLTRTRVSGLVRPCKVFLGCFGCRFGVRVLSEHPSSPQTQFLGCRDEILLQCVAVHLSMPVSLSDVQCPGTICTEAAAGHHAPITVLRCGCGAHMNNPSISKHH